MRLLPAVAVAALLLAGCASQPATHTDSPATSGAAARVLPTELRAPVALPSLRLGGGSGEPNIAVAPDGTIYVTPIDHVYRSTDGGATFKAIGTPGCAFPFGLRGTPCPPGQEDTIAGTDGHGDGDIAVDATGRLHWLGLFGKGAIPYQSSADQGATFTESVDLSDKTPANNNGTGSDREWLDARGTTLYASWRDSSHGGIIAARTSLDGGATWGELRKMADDAVGGPLVHGPVPGQVFEAMTTFAADPLPAEGKGAAIALARSFDNGTTWDLKTVLVPPQSAQFGLVGFPTSIFPVAAADDAGNLYVAFSADQRLLPTSVPKPAARLGVFLTASGDLGQTWTRPVLVSDPAHAAIMPFVVAGASGRAAVAWYENTAGLPNDALPDLWNVKLWESITANQPQPVGVTVQLNGLPNHVGSVCTSGTGCIAGGDRSLLDFFEVALTPAGHPVVAWASSAGGTAVGVAAQGTDIYFGGVKDGTPLR
ncbi:MAG TPA: sialidase family protein [Candidatus Thermoplasmatota archaeon]|nr:sialidase family protein [Candidatus Thermoplasmatota archaeon]